MVVAKRARNSLIGEKKAARKKVRRRSNNNQHRRRMRIAARARWRESRNDDQPRSSEAGRSREMYYRHSLVVIRHVPLTTNDFEAMTFDRQDIHLLHSSPLLLLLLLSKPRSASSLSSAYINAHPPPASSHPPLTLPPQQLRAQRNSTAQRRILPPCNAFHWLRPYEHEHTDTHTHKTNQNPHQLLRS